MSKKDKALNMSVAMTTYGEFIDIGSEITDIADYYICVFCRRPVRPCKSDVTAYRFSHYKQAGENCDWSKESELQLQTKRFLANNNQINMPIKGTNEVGLLTYQDAHIEISSPVSDNIADVYADINGEAIHFEVCVLNPKSTSLVKFYQSVGVTAVEINMQTYFSKFNEVNANNIEQHISDSASKHRWLNGGSSIINQRVALD